MSRATETKLAHRFIVSIVLALLVVLTTTSQPSAAHSKLSVFGGSARAGTLYEMHDDSIAVGNDTPSNYYVATSGRDVVLADRQRASLVGSIVTTSGMSDSDSGLTGRAKLLEVAPSQQNLGGQKVLVAVLAMADSPSQTITAADVRSTYFTASNSADTFFRQQSNGAVWFEGIRDPEGDSVGPIGISASGAGCDIDAITSAADSALRAIGYPVDSYDHISYMLPRLPDCDFGGRGQMPGVRTWINGYNQASVIVHELGHNLGAHHANTLSCRNTASVAVSLSGNCNSSEYGDRYDAMGLYARMMSSFHRYALGELVQGWSNVTTQRGSYPLASADVFSGSGDRLLLYPRKQPGRAVSQWFAFEARGVSAPFDDFDPSSRVVNGVSVRLVSRAGISQTHLVDATPSTSGTDEAYLPGESLDDPVSGAHFEFGSNGFDPTVSVGGTAFVDDSPPTGPLYLSGMKTTSGVRLQWSVAVDDIGFDRYEVIRNGQVIASTADQTYVDYPAADAGSVTYSIAAVDTSGNRSHSPSWTTSFASAASSLGVLVTTGGNPPSLTARRYTSTRLARGRGWRMAVYMRTDGNVSLASVNGRSVLRTEKRYFVVRFRYPRTLRRATLRVISYGAGGTAMRTIVFSRR